MQMAFKYRIYPNEEQIIILNKTFGCNRYIFNHFLDYKNEQYKAIKKQVPYTECSKVLTSLKSNLEWLKEVDSISLQQTLRDLDRAFKNFFKGLAGFPKFKSRHNHFHSYRTQMVNDNIVIQNEKKNNKIKIPKIGFVKMKYHRQHIGRILNVTVSKTNTNKYYVSLCCEVDDIEKLPKLNNSIGLDMGIKSFCITSEGKTIDNPKFLDKYYKKLLKAQRQLSSKIKGSNNFHKARIKVAKIHEKIKNCRNNSLHQLSSKLISENQVICIEDLKIKEMIKDNKFAKNISDVSWYTFRQYLEYKAKWYGREISIIDTYYPSSQICSNCGFQNKELKNLNIRIWTCEKCQCTHQRDINAAININRVGKELAEFTPVEPVGCDSYETGSHHFKFSLEN